MAIVTPTGPTDGATLISRAMHQLSSSTSSVRTLALGGSSFATMTSRPLRIFTVGLDDIKDESFLKNAKPVGWRYLIVRGGPVAVADLKDSATAEKVSFARLTHGLVAERLSQAANLADQRYQKLVEKFEVRVLEIPALYVGALWLHGPRDVFIPFLQRTQQDGDPPREDPEFVRRILQETQRKERNRDLDIGP